MATHWQAYEVGWSVHLVEQDMDGKTVRYAIFDNCKLEDIGHTRPALIEMVKRNPRSKSMTVPRYTAQDGKWVEKNKPARKKKRPKPQHKPKPAPVPEEPEEPEKTTGQLSMF